MLYTRCVPSVVVRLGCVEGEVVEVEVERNEAQVVVARKKVRTELWREVEEVLETAGYSMFLLALARSGDVSGPAGHSPS
jgi:hypothetical protein